MDDIFHEGERHVQEWTGERDRALLNSRSISGTIPLVAHTFLRQQSHCVLGWQTPDGTVRASFVAAAAGFASPASDGRSIALTLQDAIDEATRRATRPGAGVQVGMLFLEFSTRRRLRINGRVTTSSPDGLQMAVDEAFANCPKYIQRRAPDHAMRRELPAPLRSGTEITDDHRALIARADTFFVASTRLDGRADVSHRGGSPGFVDVSDGQLRIPDYAGNSMFQTLGNLSVHAAAGLTFLDFERRRQLQLSGTTSLEFLDAARSDAAHGARWWSFRWHAWTETPLPSTFDWVLVEPSPFNP
ncbi:MAG: pyridoxamine 5'-phosphate oxidase family protein [Vicinamibacterales bacterium]